LGDQASGESSFIDEGFESCPSKIDCGSETTHPTTDHDRRLGRREEGCAENQK